MCLPPGYWLTRCGVLPLGIWLRHSLSPPRSQPCQTNPVYVSKLEKPSRTANGKLPSRNADRTWGGPGEGLECSICERPVAKSEMEFEIQFDGTSPSVDKYHVHIRCFAAWEFERGKVGLAP